MTSTPATRRPSGTRRPKTRLLDAVTSLLDEHDPSEITITAIVTRAEVTRPTFYSTYGDLPTAYAHAAVTRISEALPKPVPDSPTEDRHEVMRAAIEQTLERIEPHAQFFSRVLIGHGGHQVQTEIVDLLTREFQLRTPVSTALSHGPLPAEKAATAIAAGVSWTMLTWFTTSPREPITTLAETLRDLIYHSVVGGLGGDEPTEGEPTERTQS